MDTIKYTEITIKEQEIKIVDAETEKAKTIREIAGIEARKAEAIAAAGAQALAKIVAEREAAAAAEEETTEVTEAEAAEDAAVETAMEEAAADESSDAAAAEKPSAGAAAAETDAAAATDAATTDAAAAASESADAATQVPPCCQNMETVRVIGVRFRTAGKVYFFDPGKLEFRHGAHVIVETARGVEYGTVVGLPMDVSESRINQPLKEVIRIATPEDTETEIRNRLKEKEAYRICQEKIQAHGLDMKLINAEYTFDNSKVLFYFTADGRVDFRDLVKDLAGVFRTRIELRQIGVRDETKILGGYGICGRPLCCHTWMSDFIPVSIKMAKEQNLSLNPGKISGVCGRLMCCLKNEAETYEELNRSLPKVGDEVQGNDGLSGQVESVNVLRQTVRILVEVDDEKEYHEYHVDDITVLRRRRRGGNRNRKDNADPKEVQELERLENQDRQPSGSRGNRDNRDNRDNRSNREDRGNRSNREDRGNNGNREDRGNNGNREDRGNNGNREDRGSNGNREDRGNNGNREDRQDRNNGNRQYREDRQKREERQDRNNNGSNGTRESREDRQDRGNRRFGRRRNQNFQNDAQDQKPGAGSAEE